MSEAGFDVPPEVVERVARELSPEERLVWVGQPRPDLAVRPAYFIVPFGVVFTGMALLWMVVAAFLTLGLLAPCGLPFLVIGVALILSPTWLRSLARRTAYALTDRRAIVFQPSLFGRVTVQSFTASGLGQLTRSERSDGSGDLVFQSYLTGFGTNARTVQTGFMGIDRVREVEDLVRKTLQVG
jgi:hypothetical protein